MSSARPRRRYSKAEREQALALLAELGLAAAHRQTGVPKPTLARWSADAGVTKHSDTERNARQTEAARAARARTVEETRAELVELLSAVAVTGAQLELTLLDPSHALARERFPYIVDEDTGEAHPMLAARLDQIVGARTRAIHDLNLLTGKATSNAAVVVRLEVPRPDPRAADAGAVDEADVGLPELVETRDAG